MDVAQSVRALDCGSRGRGFEPHLPPHRDPGCHFTDNRDFYLQPKLLYSRPFPELHLFIALTLQSGFKASGVGGISIPGISLETNVNFKT